MKVCFSYPLCSILTHESVVQQLRSIWITSSELRITHMWPEPVFLERSISVEASLFLLLIDTWQSCWQTFHANTTLLLIIILNISEEYQWHRGWNIPIVLKQLILLWVRMNFSWLTAFGLWHSFSLPLDWNHTINSPSSPHC